MLLLLAILTVRAFFETKRRLCCRWAPPLLSLALPLLAPAAAAASAARARLPRSRSLGVEEELLGPTSVLEPLPRRSGCGGRGCGLLPEAHGVLGIEHSIDKRTICERSMSATVWKPSISTSEPGRLNANRPTGRPRLARRP